MDGMPHDANVPQLRTLLLTDLCDSTGLVEKLGDNEAAALFRDHDRLVLELQQRWRGRLIDRSDGLLLLFERPLDGLGFALDYRRGLEALGQAHHAGPPLLARAGLHVGEVLIWRNSDEAVSAGAKPVEIEGLAKPFAARLMQLARPGQILLSAVAEPLVRRAARELGERGDALQWRTHGRWHFKGVPETQEVHEVGEPGLAPLRMPRGDAKARRDMPLWRRPMALAAEAVLVAGVAVGVWVMTRPEPAIAFAERDWVVVGDLRNLTGQTVLDDSLEQAFRISLEQSRYVNVLSDLKVQQTLALMRRKDGAALDRATASEVALRDGARAVILPSVIEVDGRLQFSAEVVDPTTQSAVYSEQASGRGLESVLDSIDTVAEGLRTRFGEAMASIQQTTMPLPRATTSNLDALRAYALAESAFLHSNYAEATTLYENAIAIDPEFMRAHLALAKLAWAQDEQEKAYAHFANAMRLRDKVTPRDRLILDAWRAEMAPEGGSLAQWLALARIYPDDFAAQSNASWYLLVENRFDEALAHSIAASPPQAPWRSYPLVHIARIHTAQGDPGEALKVLDEAGKSGRVPADGAWAEAMASMGRRDEAFRRLRAVRKDGNEGLWLLTQNGLASLAIGDRNYAEAIDLSARALDQSRGMPYPYPRHFRLSNAEVRSAAGKPVPVAELKALESDFRAALANEKLVGRYEELFRYAALVYVAQRDGHAEFAGRALRWLAPQAKKSGNRLVDKMLVIVLANQAGLEGRPDDGMRLLQAQLNGHELLLAHAVMRDLARAAGKDALAAEHEQWLRTHQGQALSEVAVNQLLQPLNVAEAGAAGNAGPPVPSRQ